MSSANLPEVYETGDKVLVDGTTREVAAVDFNNRTNCPCGGYCARLALRGGGYRRACQVTRAPETPAAPTPITEAGITAHAGHYTVRLHLAGPSACPTYRVEVLTAGGPVAILVTQLTQSFGDEGLARAVARTVTVALREGLSPEATAGLVEVVVDAMTGRTAPIAA